MGTAQIIMPENYIAMFNAPQKEQARSIVEQAEPGLQKVLTRLRAGQEFPPPRENIYDRFMSCLLYTSRRRKLFGNGAGR